LYKKVEQKRKLKLVCYEKDAPNIHNLRQSILHGFDEKLRRDISVYKQNISSLCEKKAMDKKLSHSKFAGASAIKKNADISDTAAGIMSMFGKKLIASLEDLTVQECASLQKDMLLLRIDHDTMTRDCEKHMSVIDSKKEEPVKEEA
jgi:hypothetical protein